MSDHRKQRVQNVRLVRLPNGQLVSQAEAEARGMRPVVAKPPVTPQSSQQAKQKSSPKSKSKKPSLKQRVQQYRAKTQVAKQRLRQSSSALPEKTKITVQPKANNPSTTKVEISLSLPKLPSLTKKQLLGAGAIVMVGGGLFFGGQSLLKWRSHKGSTGVLSDNTKQEVQKIPLHQSPDFGPLTPAGKNIDQLGGFAKVSPANSAPAYAFVDTVVNVKIKVTQQELPQAFKINPVSELEKTAKNFNATKILQVDGNNVYIGLSEKGPQTVIFTKDGILVFIGAEKEIPDVSWVQYITYLKKS